MTGSNSSYPQVCQTQSDILRYVFSQNSSGEQLDAEVDTAMRQWHEGGGGNMVLPLSVMNPVELSLDRTAYWESAKSQPAPVPPALTCIGRRVYDPETIDDVPTTFGTGCLIHEGKKLGDQLKLWLEERTPQDTTGSSRRDKRRTLEIKEAGEAVERGIVPMMPKLLRTRLANKRLKHMYSDWSKKTADEWKAMADPGPGEAFEYTCEHAAWGPRE